VVRSGIRPDNPVAGRIGKAETDSLIAQKFEYSTGYPDLSVAWWTVIPVSSATRIHSHPHRAGNLAAMPPTRDPAAARAASLEKQIRDLRSAMTAATRRKDSAALASVRAQLRSVQREWEHALDEQATYSTAGTSVPSANMSGDVHAARIAPNRPTVSIRDQVVQALTILGAPAAPRLIASVHEAFYASALRPKRFSTLRRDEGRSYAKSPDARPYYACAALGAESLTAVRGLLAVSTWELERRVIGPLSPRVDFLTHAAAIAERVARTPEPSAESLRLLRRFALNIPGAVGDFADPDPSDVIRSAQSELDVHIGSDRAARRAAASRARKRLDAVRQLFG
jgi:hypothetical protein